METPVQAKYDATVHIAQAERAGAELIDQAIASAVEVGADGRVSGVRYKRPDASEARATAKVYVIAAHRIARLPPAAFGDRETGGERFRP